MANDPVLVVVDVFSKKTQKLVTNVKVFNVVGVVGIFRPKRLF